MLLSNSQLQNALLLMVVTLAGISIDVRPLPLKASTPIVVTPSGIIVPLHPTTNVFDVVSIIALQLSRESSFVFFVSTVIVVNLGQELKA